MKQLILLLLFVGCLPAAHAREVRFVLVPTSPTVTSSKHILVDVYLLNEGRRATIAPGLERVSFDYSVTDVTRKRLPIVGNLLETASRIRSGHLISPHMFEHRRMTIEITTQPGDCVVLSAEISGPWKLKSNSVVVCNMAELR